jgi:hypothetical protein
MIEGRADRGRQNVRGVRARSRGFETRRAHKRGDEDRPQGIGGADRRAGRASPASGGAHGTGRVGGARCALAGGAAHRARRRLPEGELREQEDPAHQERDEETARHRRTILPEPDASAAQGVSAWSFVVRLAETVRTTFPSGSTVAVPVKLSPAIV